MNVLIEAVDDIRHFAQFHRRPMKYPLSQPPEYPAKEMEF